MGIEEKINADIKTAMLAKNAARLEALRAIKSVVLILKTSPSGLTEDGAIKAIKTEHKKRKETAEIYIQQNRQDLADVELSQANILEEYLPQQMSEDEVRLAVAEVISETGAKTPAEMGKVMSGFKAKYEGKADGKLVSTIVKDELAKITA